RRPSFLRPRCGEPARDRAKVGNACITSITKAICLKVPPPFSAGDFARSSLRKSGFKRSDRNFLALLRGECQNALFALLIKALTRKRPVPRYGERTNPQ